MSPHPSLQRRDLSSHQAYGVVDELEADGAGGVANARTVFLTASECPVGCHMCDLWVNTLVTKTPPGAIPKQLESLPPLVDAPSGQRWIKLYNSGNFFDLNSIPPDDYPAIAGCCEPYQRVVVENHPKIGRNLITRFRDHLQGSLEIAIGLETVQPRWLDRMGKKMSRDDFDSFASWLSRHGIDIRVFLIVGVPGASVGESIRWAKMSTKHAILNNARHVSLIPARKGNGWNGLGTLPAISASEMLRIQHWAIGFADGRAVVTVDTWDMSESGEDDLVNEINQVNHTQRVA